MGWRALGGESGCGNTHRPVWCTRPAPPTNTRSPSFLPFLCPIWQLPSDLLCAGNCRSSQWGSARLPPRSVLPACSHLLGWLQPWYFWACVRTAQVHTHLLPGHGEAWRPGTLDYFISLRLSKVLRQCTGLHCPGCVNLSVSSLFFIEMSPVQVTANIPRKSRQGLLTGAPVQSQNQETCPGIPAQPASR